MHIHFNKVLPNPIKELNYSNSEIWDKDIEFNSKNKYLVKAASGMGKTTFLSIIYGIRRDYEGYASIEKKDIKSYNSNELKMLRKNNLSIVFQGLKLFPELSAYENIEIKNKLTNYYSKEQIYDFAEMLGISQFMERQSSILSFGQRQRLAIIRSLCQPFDFLLLDEPFSHLDYANAQICLDLIANECDKRSSGFILTTLGSQNECNYDKIIEL